MVCRVIVGAPRDNVTDGSAAVRRLVRPGAVYQCPFTSSTDDCSPIIIDREGTNNDDITFGIARQEAFSFQRSLSRCLAASI